MGAAAMRQLGVWSQDAWRRWTSSDHIDDAGTSAMAPRQLLKTAATVPLVLTGSVIGVLCLRAFLVYKHEPPPPPTSSSVAGDGHRRSVDPIECDPDMIARFRKAVTFETVSLSPQNTATNEILRFHEHIVQSFPNIHNSSFVKWQIVNNFSLLYIVHGSQVALKPYMLAAHLDVVPVNADTWSVPPFKGVLKDGFVYGRGTLDDKQNVMGILEALEYLLKTGFRPRRSICIAFGHDEEVSGFDGAKRITDVLFSENVELEFILDEGLVVTNNMLPGISLPTALIGVTEKGYLTLKLTVESSAGHSSVPPPETSIGILVQALSRLQRNPHPSKLGQGPERVMFESIAAYASPFYRLIYANMWFFAPLLSIALSKKPDHNSIARTTTAITMINGGLKENVIPSTATAVVNHRIHPVQSVREVLEYDNYIINDDRVKISVSSATEPAPISRHDAAAFGYGIVKKSIRQVFSNVVVVPAVMIANTDCRWYKKLSKNVYRFSPTFLFPDDIKRIHGDDERIAIGNYEQVINFYYNLIINAEDEKLPGYRFEHEL